VDEEFLCQICASVQEKPTVACENGHTFCFDCIEDWEKSCAERSEPVVCPGGCNARILANKTLNRPLQNVIAKLQVNCPLGEEFNAAKKAAAKRARLQYETTSSERLVVGTCNWQGTLGDYVEKHSVGLGCPLTRVTCCCGEEMRAHEVEDHQETVCPFYKIPCVHCNKKVPRESLRYHIAGVCPEVEKTCLACGEKMPRKDLGGKKFHIDSLLDDERYYGHMRTCPKFKVLCPYWNYGCYEEVEREDMDDHLIKNARKHASIVSGELKSIRDGMRFTETRICWTIPMHFLARMRAPEHYSPESHRLKVGDYNAFLKLHENDSSGDVVLRICVETPPCHLLKPRIDGILVHSLLYDHFEMSHSQEMKEDTDGSFLCVEVPLEKEKESDDDDETMDGATATVPLTLVDIFDPTSLLYRLSVSFRLAGPAEVELGCV